MVLGSGSLDKSLEPLLREGAFLALGLRAYAPTLGTLSISEHITADGNGPEVIESVPDSVMYGCLFRGSLVSLED